MVGLFIGTVCAVTAFCGQAPVFRCEKGGKKRAPFLNQARGAGVVTGLVPCLVSLAVLSSAPGEVQAVKPRPQHTLPFFPYRYGLPSGRESHAMSTAADGSVWVFGGSIPPLSGGVGEIAAGFCGEMHKLGLQERTWHAVTTPGPQPSGRWGHTMAAVANGTMLLVFGGSTYTSGSSDEAWTFSVLHAGWAQLTAGAPGAWPSARYGHAMVAVSATRVLVFGGRTAKYFSTYLDDAWTLHVFKEEWTQLTAGAPGTWPSARYGHAMATVSDTRVLLFGGETADGYSLDEAWIFEWLYAEWTQLTAGKSGAWPSARSGHTMVAVSDTRVLLFGGKTASGCSDELWSLDVPRNSWTQLTTGEPGVRPTLTARYGHTMATVSATRVILFGGKRMSDFSPSDELFSLEFLDTASHTVRCTRLNDETVTAEELSGQFNSLQVTRRICTMSA